MAAKTTCGLKAGSGAKSSHHRHFQTTVHYWASCSLSSLTFADDLWRAWLTCLSPCELGTYSLRLLTASIAAKTASLRPASWWSRLVWELPALLGLPTWFCQANSHYPFDYSTIANLRVCPGPSWPKLLKRARRIAFRYATSIAREAGQREAWSASSDCSSSPFLHLLPCKACQRSKWITWSRTLSK